MLMKMYSYILPAVFVLYCSSGFASSEKCVQHASIFGNDTYHECEYGCCYKWIYPCCDKVWDWATIRMIAVLSAIGCSLVVAAICGLIAMKRYKARVAANRQRQMTRYAQAFPPNQGVAGPYVSAPSLTASSQQQIAPFGSSNPPGYTAPPMYGTMYPPGYEQYNPGALPRNAPPMYKDIDATGLAAKTNVTPGTQPPN